MGSLREMAARMVTLLEASNYYPRVERISGYPDAGDAAAAGGEWAGGGLRHHS
jgi:hypothetical protein